MLGLVGEAWRSDVSDDLAVAHYQEARAQILGMALFALPARNLQERFGCYFHDSSSKLGVAG